VYATFGTGYLLEYASIALQFPNAVQLGLQNSKIGASCSDIMVTSCDAGLDIEDNCTGIRVGTDGSTATEIKLTFDGSGNPNPLDEAYVNANASWDGKECVQNSFGAHCIDVKLIGTSNNLNSFGDACNTITATGNGNSNNSFGSNCASITMTGNGNDRNVFGDNSGNSSITGDNHSANTFGSYCDGNNITGTSNSQNNFGNACSGNTISGTNNSSNTFGNNCSGNTIDGNGQNGNTFGSTFSGLTVVSGFAFTNNNLPLNRLAGVLTLTAAYNAHSFDRRDANGELWHQPISTVDGSDLGAAVKLV
jgi:hypothetical protein